MSWILVFFSAYKEGELYIDVYFSEPGDYLRQTGIELMTCENNVLPDLTIEEDLERFSERSITITGRLLAPRACDHSNCLEFVYNGRSLYRHCFDVETEVKGTTGSPTGGTTGFPTEGPTEEQITGTGHRSPTTGGTTGPTEDQSTESGARSPSTGTAGWITHAEKESTGTGAWSPTTEEDDDRDNYRSSSSPSNTPYY